MQPKLGSMPRHGATAALENSDGTTDFRDRAFRRRAVDHNQVRWISDLNAILFKPEDPRGTIRYHGETLTQLMRPPDLQHIGLQVGHPNERAVTVWRGGVQHIVAGDRAIDAVFD